MCTLEILDLFAARCDLIYTYFFGCDLNIKGFGSSYEKLRAPSPITETTLNVNIIRTPSPISRNVQYYIIILYMCMKYKTKGNMIDIL